jgi:putative selenium metabolism protein SsnA
VNCLLQHAVCLTLYPPSVESADLRIRYGVIVDRKKHLVRQPGEKVFDLTGRLIMPGLVCAHTHLYSSLSRGMPMPRRAPANFLEILQKVWWKLDRALDEESIYYSALAGAMDAVRCGTTTIFDHHASPESVGGSLDIIKAALNEVGVRGVLCYEVTDRGGKRKRDLGLAENERFIRANRENAMFRGMVGAHASFTLGDDSLRGCGEVAAACGTGIHIHAAEDVYDESHSREAYGRGIVDRFTQANLLTQDSILAHGVHFSDGEIKKVRAAGCTLVHNPRSNMNNRVGCAAIHLFGEHGALGTDGFPADMFEETKFAFFKRRDTHREERVDLMQLLDGGQRLASSMFGGRFGGLAKGAAADLVVLKYQAPTPMSKDNCGGHFLFGMQSSMVESVMTAGEWVMKDREITGVDATVLAEKAAKAAKKLWNKMRKLA